MFITKVLGTVLCSTLLVSTLNAATPDSFNPAISLILDGRYSSFSNNTDYALPGFMLGGEAGRGEEGFYLGHNELSLAADIDDLFYGKLTAAITDHEASTEVELEEAYIETRGLSHGVTITAGRFFSAIGYLNDKHIHTWDFADAPLIYRGLFGDQIKDDGMQITWLAPTDRYLKIGIEATRGGLYPAAGATNEGQGTKSLFIKTGGDVGISHAWQLGLSYWEADVTGRQAATHAHAGRSEIPSFTGSSKVSGIDFVWKWSPRGNRREQYLKLQAEYFIRDEQGVITMLNSEPLETSSYSGEQSGWYAQAVYQFIPRWRVGYRYDRLQASNRGSDLDVLGEAGLLNNGYTPERSTLMLDYSRSEYSRIRLQFAHDDSYQDSDNILLLQYTMSLGAHGAHQF